jgi:hypothetical protein
MSGTTVVAKEGQSVESIAFEAGHFWETVWKCDENADLRAARATAHQIVPGDSVFVPDLVSRSEACETNTKHVFRRRGVPSYLRLVIEENGQPQAGLDFVIEIDGVAAKGVTDTDGKIVWPITPNAKTARLRVGSGIGARIMTLQLRALQPVSELAGVQARLANLGYPTNAVDGVLDDSTRDAIRDFQTDHGLEATGEVTDDLRDLLTQEHKS